MIYRLFKNPFTNEISSVVNLETTASIPFDPENTDYQEYLVWLAEGNIPLPADE